MKRDNVTGKILIGTKGYIGVKKSSLSKKIALLIAYDCIPIFLNNKKRRQQKKEKKEKEKKS